ncbi:hypothetical protein QP858_09605 [Trueperella bernardiae]|uniref:Tetratricopeptide repeat protein n=1 Tax=Trueperella bernardiae TaxID=59561 RepID=A0AAW6ZHP1_9ACTO|nr:hypothetical protein [Trueperella bernardiae]MDK8602710.1 hypothetical protein [Trueperella bernardiae]
MSQYDNSDNSQRGERRSSGWNSASKRSGGRQGFRSDRDRQGSWNRDRNDRNDRRGSWDRDDRQGRRDDRGNWNRDRNDRREGNWYRDRSERRNWDRDDRGSKRGNWSRNDDRNDRWVSWDRNERSERRKDRRPSYRDDRRDDRGKWNRDRNDRRDGNWSRDRNDRRDDRRGNWNRDRNDRNDRRGSWDRDGRRHGNWNRERDERREKRFDEAGNQEQVRRNVEQDRLEIPESITADALDAGARKQLRSLNKDNAERVARHLVYAGEMLDIDPEIAYEHARAAYKSAARIDVVREALGLTAYATGRYSEALRELRTYRRMSDDYTHVPLEADSERGLGRPEKALRFIEGIPLQRLKAEGQIELALVTSGARAETGNSEGGLSILEKIIVENLPEELAARVQLIKADRLEELGRADEAEELRATWAPIYEGEGGDIMVDLDDVLDDVEPVAGADTTSDSSDEAESADVEDPEADEDSELSEALEVNDATDFEAELEEELAQELADELEDNADEVVRDELVDPELAPVEADVVEPEAPAEEAEAEAEADEEFVQDDLFGDALDVALEEDQELDLNEEDA